MPKQIVKDTGMRQHNRTSFDLKSKDPAEHEAHLQAWRDYAASLPKQLPGETFDEALLRERAARFKVVLGFVGLADLMDGKGGVDLKPLNDRGLNEASFEWIAAHWLGAYNRLMVQRKKLIAGDTDPMTIDAIVNHAQELVFRI